MMGVGDESTRKKLLQVAKFTLSQSIDICRSYETTSKQLESMKAEGVLAVDKETPKHREHRNNDSGVENVIRCKFCGKTHVRGKFQCPAWGKVCYEITLLQCVLANPIRVHESDFQAVNFLDVTLNLTTGKYQPY